MCEDGLDALVAECPEGQGAGAGGLQPRRAVVLAQAQHPQARPVALDGVGAGGEYLLHHLGGGGPGLLRPADQTIGTPLHVFPVVAGHVLQHRGVSSPHEGAQVRGHPRALVEDLHGVGGEADLDLGAQELIGHGVIVPVHLHVVVDADPRLLPLLVLVGPGRQGLEGGLIEREKERFPAALQPLEGAAIVLRQKLSERLVQLPQGKKRRCRSWASSQRSTPWTPASALALSRGRRMRAGSTAAP